MVLYLFLTVITLGLGLSIWLQFIKKTSAPETDLIQENAKLIADITQKDQKIGELQSGLDLERQEKNELSGKNKQMFIELDRLQHEHRQISTDKQQLQKTISKFEEAKERQEKELEVKILKLEEARNSLEDEKIRIRREDEARQEQILLERDRIWNEHENNVKLALVSLCKEPEYNLPYFDNQNLPEGFSGKFKPDFLIQFLEQYIIFDAKISKSNNLQTYINTAIKDTVKKVNGDPAIYSTIYLIVPTEAIATLTKTRFLEKGYTCYIITIEALPAVLAAYKKITNYELAEQLDPLERENIVNLIAEFDFHINQRNAIDILSAKQGLAVLEKAHLLKGDFRKHVDMQKSKIRLQQFSPNDLKQLLLDTTQQEDTVNNLLNPQPAIDPQDILDTP